MRNAISHIVIHKGAIGDAIAPTPIQKGKIRNTICPIIIQKEEIRDAIASTIIQKWVNGDTIIPTLSQEGKIRDVIYPNRIQKVPTRDVIAAIVFLKGEIRCANAPDQTNVKPIKPNKYEKTSKKASIVFTDQETETFTIPFKTSFLADLRKKKGINTFFTHVTK